MGGRGQGEDDWFDAVATRYGCMLQGATTVALTNLDVLGYLDEIPVCVAYETADGVTESFPVTSKLAVARPVLRCLPGGRCDISQITSYELLPEAAKRYVHFVESAIGVPVSIVSVGPGRGQTLMR